jgi:3',5'-cyclic AMP phosphodiesterase CpdA
MNHTVHLAHLSDVHLGAPACRWGLHDWCSKRLTGWLHLRFGRGRRFLRADDVIAALIAELKGEHRPDCVVFSGDATALGFPEEVARSAVLLGVGDPALPPGLAVPGNHDYYTRRDEHSGVFERCFATWQTGERIDGSTYPFAKRIGLVWLVGVNSSSGKIWPWDASGRVGPTQLERLERLLHGLAPGHRILVTHFPVTRPDGSPERVDHRLHDLADLLKVAERGGVCLWLHGHDHHPFQIDDRSLAPFPVICAGSTTQHGQWGYNEYVIDGPTLRALRRVYDPDANGFRNGPTFELTLGSKHDEAY